MKKVISILSRLNTEVDFYKLTDDRLKFLKAVYELPGLKKHMLSLDKLTVLEEFEFDEEVYNLFLELRFKIFAKEFEDQAVHQADFEIFKKEFYDKS